jgi:uncharacterized membrane protein/mono/diheme cytochrome c family protein
MPFIRFISRFVPRQVWGRWAAVLAAATIGGRAPAADPGSAARAVFAARCGGCHGADLPRPRGRFGYVLDLRRVAGNPEMVIPGRPDESELWALVRHDDMPPPGSAGGPLTAAEKEAVRAWIAAGAPDATAAEPAEREPAPAAPPADRTLRWVGKLHLLAVHFPIALVIAAGLAELLAAWRRERVPSAAGRYCLGLAAAAAVPTAALGWLHAAAGNGASAPGLLFAHRWLGTAAAAWLVVTAIAAERDARRGVRTGRVRLLLAVGVLLTAAAAHLGGLLDHGAEFFEW